MRFLRIKMRGFILNAFILLFLVHLLAMANANIADSKEFMSGKVLRVGIYHYPPAINITWLPDGNFTYSGSGFGIMELVAQGLNISYEWVFLKDADMKKFGVGPGQVKMLTNNGDVDITIFGMIASHAKYLEIDLTIPIIMEPFRLIVPWPKEESRLWAIIRPFQLPVWISLGVTILAMATSLSLLSGLFLRYVGHQEPTAAPNRPPAIIRPIISFASMLHNFSFLLSHLTNQGYHYNLHLRSRGSVILVGIWCLMCVVLANGYGGVHLFSFLSVSKLEPIVNSLEELAESETLQLTILYRTELEMRFSSATSGLEKVIGDSLRAHPDNLLSSPLQAKEKLRTGRYVYTFLDLFTNGLIDALYRENGNKCKVTIGKEPISVFSPGVFGLAKNSPYTQSINEAFQIMIEAGLLEHVWSNYMPNIDRCKMENQKTSSHQKPLSLVDMSSAFVVLGLGTSLAVLVFLLELIYKRIKDHYFTDDDTMVSKKTLSKPANNNQRRHSVPITKQGKVKTSDDKKATALPIAVKIPSAKIIKQGNDAKNTKIMKKDNAEIKADTKSRNNIPAEVHVDMTKRADGHRANIPVGNQRNKAAILSFLDEILEI